MNNPTLPLQIATSTDRDWLREQFVLAFQRQDGETQVRINNRRKELDRLEGKSTPAPRPNRRGYNYVYGAW